MQTFTDIKMLYCYLVLQDWSVSIEKPFVLCRCVIFFSLLSHRFKRSTENSLQGSAWLNLSLIWLIAVFALLPSRYVNAAVWTAAGFRCLKRCFLATELSILTSMMRGRLYSLWRGRHSEALISGYLSSSASPFTFSFHTGVCWTQGGKLVLLAR